MLNKHANDTVFSYEPFPRLEKEKFWLLQDRRANPYVKSRRRKVFDRRNALRVGTNIHTFIDEKGKTVPAAIKDISDSGICIEVPDLKAENSSNLTIGIPFLNGSTIDGEVIWREKEKKGNRNCRYGIKFNGLTGEQKRTLRESILLDELLFTYYAEEMAARTDDPGLRQKIQKFFLTDMKTTVERLIDIDKLIADGEEDEKIKTIFAETQRDAMAAAYKLETSCNHDVSLVKQIKQRVRGLLGHFLYQSWIYRRAFEKPRGYPAAYNNKALSEGIGKYYDGYCLGLPYTVSIRLRKDMMREILYDYINSSTNENLKILNLASGGCREIREMFNSPILYEGTANLMCIDLDEEAIAFAREKLSNIDTGNITVNLIQGNIVRMGDLNLGKKNCFDMIYSIGVADYLQDRMLAKMLKDSYALLKPGGKLIVAYKDKERNKPLDFNWYGDWNFVPRSEGEFITIINDSIGEKNISIELKREGTGVIFFAMITKKK